jgi:hypothetical protein
MNKLILIILTSLMILPIQAQAQSNRDILDKLEEMQFDRELRELERDLQRQNNRQQLPPPTPSLPYRNTQTEAQRNENAKLWNLSYSEYLRRDEIGETLCKKYQGGTQNHIKIWLTCYRASLLNISFTEMEDRDFKAQKKCSGFEVEKKRKCVRDVVVLNK